MLNLKSLRETNLGRLNPKYCEAVFQNKPILIYSGETI